MRNILKDPFNPQDALLLVQVVPRYFNKPSEVSPEKLVSTLTEMLPDENLENIAEKLKTEIRKISAKNEMTFALSSLLRAVESKLKKEKTLQQELNEIQQEEIKSPVKDARIKEITEILNSVKAIEANTIEARIKRLHSNARMLNEIISNAPSYIQNHTMANNQGILDYLRKFNAHYHQLIQAQAESRPSLEMLAPCEKAEMDCERLIAGICTAINVRVIEQGREISAGGHNKILADYQQTMNELNELTKPASNALNYYKKTEQFEKMIDSLLTLIKEFPDTAEEIEYRNKAALAQTRIEEEFPKDKYTYFITPGDLRNSQNALVVDQIKLSESYSGKIEDKGKFILSGMPKDASKQTTFLNNVLKQITKDMSRELKIDGNSYAGQARLSDEDLTALLNEKFKENAAYIMTHFDQGITLIIGGGVGQGVTGTDMMEEYPLAIKPPDTLDQNLYPTADGVAYRTIALDHFNLMVPQDEHQGEWKLKVNLKALCWASKDGFVVESIATDSPLICNALLRNSSDPEDTHNPKQQLTDLVNKVLDIEARINAELEGLKDKVSNKSGLLTTKKAKENIELNIGSKKQHLEEMLKGIKQFKNGEINFDGLVNIITDYQKKIHDLNPTGEFRQLLKKYTPIEWASPTAQRIMDISNDVTKFKKELDASANTYKRENRNVEPEKQEHESISLLHD